MEAIKVSVVIPVYNVIDYLEACVRSVAEQSLRDIEIILIDDGSSDGSYEKCQELARNDKRISVFAQKHLRASAARNNGLRRARGEYVMFVDSDDIILPGALQTLWNAAQDDDLDVVRASLCIVDESGVREDARRARISTELMRGDAFFCHVVAQNAYSCSVVLGLYRRRMIVENKLYFLEGHAFEDELWTPCMLLAAKRVRYVHTYFYHHVMWSGSVMHTRDTDRQGRDLVAVARAMAQVQNVPESVKRVWYDNVLGKYFSGFCIGRMYRPEYRDIVSKGFPIPYARGVKNRLRTCIYLLNYRLFVWLNTLGVRLNRARGIVRS